MRNYRAGKVYRTAQYLSAAALVVCGTTRPAAPQTPGAAAEVVRDEFRQYAASAMQAHNSGDTTKTQLEARRAHAEAERLFKIAQRNGDLPVMQRASLQNEELAVKIWPADHEQLIKARLLVCIAKVGAKQTSDALNIYKDLEQATRRQPEGNSENRIHALFGIARLTFELARAAKGDNANDLDQQARTATAQLVADAERLLPPESVPARDAHMLATLVTWKFWTNRAEAAIIQGAAASEVLADLKNNLRSFETELASAGTQDAWCQLGNLWLAECLHHLQMVDTNDESFDQLSAILQSDFVTGADKARYWNISALRETERLNYNVALDLHARAMAVRKQSAAGWDETQRKFALAETLNNMGHLLLHIGDYPQAEQHLTQAYEIYAGLKQYDAAPSAEHQVGAMYTLANLAEASRRGGQLKDFRRAADLLNQASKLTDTMAPQAAGDFQQLRILLLNNLALAHYYSGELALAAKSLARAREQAVAFYSAKHERVGEIDVNLGWVALEQGDLVVAQQRFEAALAVFRNQDERLQLRTAECLAYLARVHVLLGRSETARELLEDALRQRNRTVQLLLDQVESERHRLAIVQELRFHTESIAWPGVLDTFIELGETLKIPTHIQYAALLEWKGLVARQALPGPAELEDEAKVQNLALARQNKLQQLRRLTPLQASLSIATSDEIPLVPAQRVKLSEEIEGLTNQLAAVSNRFRDALQVRDVKLGAVLGALRPKQALLDVLQFQKFPERKAGQPIQRSRSYAIFILKSGSAVDRLSAELDCKKIDESIGQLLPAMETPPGEWQKAGRDLSAALRKPLESRLDKVETVIVSGDGKLLQLPWALLPAEVGEKCWCQDRAFSVVGTAQSLVARRKASPKSENKLALLVGDVDYGASDGKSKNVVWGALPHTRIELLNLEKSLQGTSPKTAVEKFTEANATVENVLLNLPRCKYAHFATHGRFNSTGTSRYSFRMFDLTDQLNSAIVLAGANRAKEEVSECLLTAEQLNGLDLSGVELIALSACQSGLGHVNEGQGVIGLQGAFEHAHVRRSLTSLWKVHDEATQLLMTAFYSRLLNNRAPSTPAESLRQAQLDLATSRVKGSANRSFEHPAYWAAWTLSGLPD